MSDQLPKLGPKARVIVDAMLREGIYRASKESEITVCRNLNSRQLLSRDKRDGAVWYPTAKLCELAGVTLSEIGQGREGGPGAPDSRVQPEQGADRLPAPAEIEPSPTADLPPLTRLLHHPLAALFPMLPDDELRRLAGESRRTGSRNRSGCSTARSSTGGTARRLAIWPGSTPGRRNTRARTRSASCSRSTCIAGT